jgi:hypothetical protein
MPAFSQQSGTDGHDPPWPCHAATPPGARARAASRRCGSTVVLGVGWASLMAAPLMTQLAKLTSPPPVGPSRSVAATHAMCLDRAKPGLAAHRTPRRNARQRTDAARRPRELTETAGKPGRTESVISRVAARLTGLTDQGEGFHRGALRVGGLYSSVGVVARPARRGRPRLPRRGPMP